VLKVQLSMIRQAVETMDFGLSIVAGDVRIRRIPGRGAGHGSSRRTRWATAKAALAAGTPQ
jgi:hypothetical protein